MRIKLIRYNEESQRAMKDKYVKVKPIYLDFSWNKPFLNMPFLKALIIFIYIFSCAVYANGATLTVNHFKELGSDINRDPYPVYLQLLEIEKKKRSALDEGAYLWLLYRKAQSEKLLYLNEKFEKTVVQAAQLITPTTDVEVNTGLTIYQGIIAQRKGFYEDAITHFEQAMKVARANSLSHLYILGKQEVAYTYTLKEHYETSLSDMQEAYVAAFALDDHFLIAVINETYGAIYGYMDDYDKSIEYYQKALDTYERLGYQPFVAEAIYGLATTFRYWKKYDLAIQKYTQYRDKIAYTPNQNISFFGEYGLGVTYAQSDRCEEAIPVIEHALTLNGEIDYNAELYKHKSVCLLAMNQIAAAEQALAQAQTIYDQLPELDGTSWKLGLVKVDAHILYAKGEIEAGYQKLQEYYENYTELLINNASQKLIRIRETMDLERLDIEISALKQREKYQLLQVKQQKQQVEQQYFMMIFAFSITAFILFILYLQHKNNKKIFALSITDSLTEVFNRRYVFEYLDKLLAKTSGHKGELSVLLFDIDDFKQVNDEHGHPFGDDVLCQVVDVTQTTLRTGDILGRIGGEEFFCILPRTDSKMALQVAQRLKDNIQNEFFCTADNRQVMITVSIGIAELGNTATDRASLYVQSDKALYQAKQQGKNQVVIYNV